MESETNAADASVDRVVNERTWIGEIVCRSVKTVLVKACSRKQAEERLREIGSEHVVGIDVSYDERGRRIVREDSSR